MIKNVNDTLTQGINTLVPPIAVKHREINVTDVGVGLTTGVQFTFIDVNNDDNKDDVFVVVGLTVPSTDVNNGAIRLKPKESLELVRNQIPDNTKALAFQTVVGQAAVVRVLWGEE